MPNRTLTINNADGSSETYTINRDKFEGVRSMSVDGETVTVDHTAPDNIRNLLADGQTITIDRTSTSIRTLTIDGVEITIDRSEEATIESLLQQFTGASAAYSLRDLASSSGNTTVVRVRRSSDNTEEDFKASEVADGTLENWVIDNSAPSIPADFPVTLKARNSSYYIEETGNNWFSNYNGETLYVSPSGSDINGDGSQNNPFKSLNTVISNSSNNDIINMSAGVYAMPTFDVSKDLAFVCPSGKAYIGTFNDLSNAQIDEFTYSGKKLYNVDSVVSGEPFKGWLRTDGNLVSGVRGSAVSLNNTQAISYQDLGIMSVYVGSNSSNFSTGTNETLHELVDAGSVLAWTDANTDRFKVATDTSVYIGENITLASNATAVVSGNGSSELILDGCEIYGGSDSSVSHSSSGKVLMFNNIVAGSGGDNIDYRGTVVAVESNITSNWCCTAPSDNTSTGHDSCKVIRVGGTYRGGSRTVHDVNDTKAYVYSCTIGDAISNDKKLLLSGFPSITSETCTLDYGDITFIDTFNDGGLTDLSIDSESVSTLHTFPDGFVDTWYDQSGNVPANNAVQTNPTNQPKIVNDGRLVTDNGIGGLDFDGNNFLTASSVSGLEGSISMFSVSVKGDSSGYVVSPSSSSASTRYFGIQEASTSSIIRPRNTAVASASASVSSADRLTFAVTTGDTSTSIGSNGSAVTTTTSDYGADFSGSNLDQIAIGVIRTVSITGYFQGRIREIIIYPSDQSDNRADIEDNINNQYEIY